MAAAPVSPSVRSSVRPSVLPSVRRSVRLFIRPSAQVPVCSSVRRPSARRLSVRPLVRLSVYYVLSQQFSIASPMCSHIWIFFPQSVRPSFLPSVHPSIRPSVRLSFLQSDHLSVRPSIRSSVHSSFLPTYSTYFRATYSVTNQLSDSKNYP